jgi:hypothetical protein
MSVIKRINPESVIEIGSATGNGSTRAITSACGKDTRIVCLEIMKGRVEIFKTYYPGIRIINDASVPASGYVHDEAISDFLMRVKSNTSLYSLTDVLGWKNNELKYAVENGFEMCGAETAVKELGGTPDFALIDGSAFTACKELEIIGWPKCISLDDTNDIKNYHNYRMLKENKDYKVFCENQKYRNGYAIFVKKDL